MADELVVKEKPGKPGKQDAAPLVLADVIAASKISKPATAMIPEGVTKEQEVKSKRTEISKTFKLEPGRFKSIYTPGMAAVHYRENPNDQREQLKDIDLTLSAHGVCSKAPYVFTAFKDKVGYRMEHRDTGGWTEVELIEIAGSKPSLTQLSTRVDGNLFFWDNVTADVSFYCVLLPDRVRLVRAIQSEEGARSFKWQVRQKDGDKVRFRNKTTGIDAKRRNCEVLNDTDIGPFVEGEYKSILFEEQWTGNVGEVADRKNRQKAWTTDVTYPVMIS
jgi:hypothetical protein